MLKCGDTTGDLFRSENYLSAARCSFSGVSGFDLHALDFFVDLVEPPLKLQRFNLHSDFAALADDMRFAVMFEVAHEQRILEATLRASDVDSFVFKHFLTSP